MISLVFKTLAECALWAPGHLDLHCEDQIESTAGVTAVSVIVADHDRASLREHRERGVERGSVGAITPVGRQA